MSERSRIARDLAHTGCGCDEDTAETCQYMQGGYCSRPASFIEEALSIARADGMREAARIAYGAPHYVSGMDPDEFGVMPPGSPYDRGRHDAMKAILSAIGETRDE